VKEIDNLSQMSSPEDALMGIAAALRTGYEHKSGFRGRDGIWKYNFPVPFVTFTGVVRREVPDHASRRVDDYGTAFAAYIQEHGLGTIIRSETRENWTTNDIAIWIWQVDYNRLLPHLDSLGV
jgi:hypothetical protein